MARPQEATGTFPRTAKAGQDCNVSPDAKADSVQGNVNTGSLIGKAPRELPVSGPHNDQAGSDHTITG